MKKILLFTSAVIAALSLFSCNKEQENLVNFKVCLTCDNAPLEEEGINFIMSNESKTEFSFVSDAKGQVQVSLPEGNYSWTAYGKVKKAGAITTYNGASTSPCVVKQGLDTLSASVSKVITSSIIIKELYFGGFTDGTTTKGGIDNYIILYNNTAEAVDASDIVIGTLAPANAHATNNYIVDGKLSYEDAGWIPAYCAFWWFTNPVTIPAYSQIVVAVYGAINHTETYANSVNLSKSEYYWMSNEGIEQFAKGTKYTVSTDIPKTNYMTCFPYSAGTVWVTSNNSPAIFIGSMKASDALKLSQDSENYDKTCGKAIVCVKFPQANILDAIEVYSESNLEKSQARFPKKFNTGYTPLTNFKGHTSYRNVDKAATEALAENAGKLVTGYPADPSGIDAEASIKNGAHIVFMDTNSSTNDFHQREVASIK